MNVQVLIVNGHPEDYPLQAMKTIKQPLSFDGVTAMLLEVPALGLLLSSEDHPDRIQFSALKDNEEPTEDNMGVGEFKLKLADLLPVGEYEARLFLIDPAHPQGRPLITEESITKLILRVLQ